MKDLLIERIANLKERNNFVKAELKKSIDLKEKEFIQSILNNNKTRINECEFLLAFIKD